MDFICLFQADSPFFFKSRINHYKRFTGRMTADMHMKEHNKYGKNRDFTTGGTGIIENSKCADLPFYGK
jgi:hypothetical protein